MQIQLSRTDLEILRQQALESVDLGDDGESFADEAIARFADDDLLVIEELGDVDPHEFFAGVLQTWDRVGSEDLLETLIWMLEDLDIELAYDAEDEGELAIDEEWEDDVELDDDDEDEPGHAYS